MKLTPEVTTSLLLMCRTIYTDTDFFKSPYHLSQLDVQSLRCNKHSSDYNRIRSYCFTDKWKYYCEYHISEFWFASASKRVYVQYISYKNEFDLHKNELVSETHFQKNGFALRLVLTQRQTGTRKWAISSFTFHFDI